MASERRRTDPGTAAQTLVPRPIGDDDWGFLVGLSTGPARRPVPERIEPSYMALDTASRRLVLLICIIVLLALAGFASASLPEGSERTAASAHPTSESRIMAHGTGHAPVLRHKAGTAPSFRVRSA